MVTSSKRQTTVSTVTSQVLREERKDAREAALEEEILGVGDNVIDALPDVGQDCATSIKKKF